ncbi:MAG: putative xanthine dehydrogenase FAD-binding subunit [Acidimicrobiales bacterium]|nr:putative xanthine dehydrogenase FAD-binding subunit [Acidimicrobiales bacterium]
MPVLVPTSLDDAVSMLADAPDALVLAGGTDAMVEINMGHRHAPTRVIALNRVAELRSWTFHPDTSTLRIGAAVTYAEMMEPPIADLVPALAQAARTVGSPQIRHAGTLGGNLGTCSPAGDGLPVLAALDAVVHLASSAGERSMPVAEFMVGVKRNARWPEELIAGVTLPVLSGYQGYTKVGVRNAMVIALATACVVVDTPSRSIRLAIGSVAPTIIRCGDAEGMAMADVDFASGTASAATVARFGELAAASSRPIDDHRATADYRRHAISVLSSRLLRRAFPHES